MKISIWKKYHIIKWVCGFLLYSLFFIISIFFGVIISLIVVFPLMLLLQIYLHSIKCPKCNKPIDNWTTLCSVNNDGMFAPMSKTCRTCGYDFTETEV